ncbi:hypothetical protein [Haloarchaeobius amylolyticus]|uniref:hypothetical protein n=1 Tax=Haloarchaeobius amylolyticus TaxID=1198296 RepID=UPI00226EEFD7|nr:hypothetical protein [Haloarchaeobius amylolyticus]
MTGKSWYNADLDLADLVDGLDEEYVVARIKVQKDISDEERQILASHFRGLAASLSERTHQERRGH